MGHKHYASFPLPETLSVNAGLNIKILGEHGLGEKVKTIRDTPADVLRGRLKYNCARYISVSCISEIGFTYYLRKQLLKKEE